MKRFVLDGVRSFALQEVDPPTPKRGEALLKMRKVGICGSDLHVWRTLHIGEVRIDRPLTIGHECVADVVDAGEGVERSLVGKRVAIEPAMSCGRCKWCRLGLTNVCPNVQFLGMPPQDGALREYMTHPARLLEPLSDKVSDEAGVVFEPMAVALHAVNLVNAQPGQSAVILGTGVLGTCALELLALRGCPHIVCVDLLEDRLARAARLGATGTVKAEPGQREEVVRRIMPLLPEGGADVVIDCAGVPETIWNMCEVAAPGGHVAVIGIDPEDRFSCRFSAARRKGLTIRMVRRSLNTLPACIRLTEAGLIEPERLVTHTFRASELDEAFRTVDTVSDGVLKALIDIQQW